MIKQKMVWLKTPEESLIKQLESKLELRRKKIAEIEAQYPSKEERAENLKEIEDLLEKASKS
jgi:hypothetical protein